MARNLPLLPLFLLACGGSSTPPQASPPAVANEADARPEWVLRAGQASTHYGNDSGLRVSIVPVSKRDEPLATDYVLIHATGTASKYDGLVLVGRRSQTDRAHLVKANLRGEPVTLLTHFKSSEKWHFAGFERTGDDDEQLRAVSEPVDAEMVLRLRHEQRALETRNIEATTRAEKERWQNQLFDESIAAYAPLCPRLKASIDWKSISDELLDASPIASRCQILPRAANDFCRQHPEKAKALSEKVSLICAFQDDTHKAPTLVDSPAKGTIRYAPGSGDNRFRAVLRAFREELDLRTEVVRGAGWTFIVRYHAEDTTVHGSTNQTFYPASSSADTNPRTFRIPGGAVSGYLDRKDGSWDLVCGKVRQPLEVVTETERDAVLRTATYEKKSKWKREPYFLSRDTRGTYYYVDKYRKVFGGKRYRVFVGRRGQLELTKLKGVVEDSEGTVFSTDSGELRLVVSSGDQTAVWIRGRKKTPLTPVNTRANLKLIYDELGVYYGADTGFVCE